MIKVKEVSRILKTLLHLIILLVTSVTAVYTEWSALLGAGKSAFLEFLQVYISRKRVRHI